MHESTIKEIERALPHHINYEGIPSNGKYLEILDRVACNYSGEKSEKISKLLDNYFIAVGVSNLDEAFERLKKIKETT